MSERKPFVGRWKQIDVGMSPGGTPGFVCSRCGGTEHLHGAEFPKRPPYCIECGAINFYPWEKLYEVPEHDDD